MIARSRDSYATSTPSPSLSGRRSVHARIDVPVAQVTGRDVREREMQRLGNDRAAEDLDRHRLDARRMRERLVELLRRPVPLLRLVLHRAECEDGERTRRELRPEPAEERARVLMPSAHVERCAEDDRLVLVERAHEVGGQRVSFDADVGEMRGHELRDLVRRAVLRCVCDENFVHGTSEPPAARERHRGKPARTV